MKAKPILSAIALVAGLVGAQGMATVDPMACGDGAFRLRRDPVKARESLACYRQAREADPKSTEIAWRLAMATQFVGMRFTPDRDEKLSLFEEGRDAATQATKAAPDCGPCHFWAGINRALYGETSGIFRTIATLGIVRQNLERAAEIDAAYAHGGPHRILGLIDQKVPGILGGSNADAIKHFEKAIAAAPDNSLNYLFLARLHRDEYEDEAAVRQVLARAKAKVRKPPPEDVESFEAWHELQDLEVVTKPAEKVQGDVSDVGSAVDNG